MKKASKTTKLKKLNKPKRSSEMPVTKKLLDLTEKKLKSEITSLKMEMRAGFSSMEGRFKNMEGKFEGKFKNIDSRFERMDGHISDIKATLFRMEAMLEEQNIKNNVVLDGYTHLYDHQIATNQRLESLEKVTFGVKQK